MEVFELSCYERFWHKVGATDSCWEWEACKNPKGYGRILLHGKNVRAHRAAWRLFRREIPDGTCVLHKCDNPSCVNPQHLFLGTHQDNIVDMYKKGRGVDNRGSKQGNSKFTKWDIHTIRGLYECGHQQKWIAKIFNTTKEYVWKIVHRKTWAWLK